jgi:hypothetical protein
MLTHADEIDDDGMYLFRHMLAPKVLLDVSSYHYMCVISLLSVSSCCMCVDGGTTCVSIYAGRGTCRMRTHVCLYRHTWSIAYGCRGTSTCRMRKRWALPPASTCRMRYRHTCCICVLILHVPLPPYASANGARTRLDRTN